MAALLLGCKVLPLWPTDGPDTLLFKLMHSDASVIVCENEDCLQLVESCISQCSQLKLVIMMPHASDDKNKNFRERDIVIYDDEVGGDGGEGSANDGAVVESG